MLRRIRLDPRAWALPSLLLAAALAFGMQRGVLLSDGVKTVLWPWAANRSPGEVVAPYLTDPVWQFAPWLTFARGEIAAGRVPLWNPHQDGGVPLLGNAQSALGSPLVWPALLLGVPAGWNVVLLLKILVALVGAFLWLRDTGRSPAAATLGAAAFALSGPFVAWLAHPHTLVAAPLPFVLLFARRLARHTTYHDLAGLALATAAVLAGGHPETALHGALVAVGFLVAETPTPGRALRAMGGACLGALLAAPLLLTSLEYLLRSAAWQGGVGRRPYVLPISDALRLLLPDAPAANPIESAASVSLAALLLVPFGLRRDRSSLAVGLLAVACLALAYDGPLARALATSTPLYWSRLLLLAPLPFAWLASAGLDHLVERARLAGNDARAERLAFLLAGLAGIELVLNARGVHATTPRRDLASTTPILERLRSESGVFRVLPLWTFLPSNAATPLGLDDLRGYDALAPAGWRRRRHADVGSFEDTPGVVDVVLPWKLRPGGEGLDFWNVRFLLLDPRFRFPVSQMNDALGLDLVEVYSGADGRILENRRVKPRVRLETGHGEVRIVSKTPTRWFLDVDAVMPARLVVANPYFPGWRVRVDGRLVRLAAKDGDPIALDVLPGRHTVELRYLPASFVTGVFVAGAGVVLSLFFCWRIRSRWRKVQSDGPSPASI